MPAPKLKLTLEPLENGKVVYLPLAAVTSKAKARGRLFLLATFQNLESKSVKVQTATLSFPGSAVPAETKTVNVTVAAGGSKAWWFAVPIDDVVFDLPAPATLKVAVQCQAFTNAKTFTFSLAPHVSPVAGSAYLFPAHAGDMDLGEFWSVNGCIHAVGSQGSQSFAYDMGVWGIDHDTGSYSYLHPKKDGTKNDHHRVWGKPVRAMADGVVLEAVNNCPNNPAPLSWTDQADLNAKLADQKAKYWGAFPNGGGGNHFYIQHGDEVVLYAHMQKGTLNPSLLTSGATVKAGVQLGKAGNAGNSSGPHLHIHAIQGTAPETGPMRPIVLRNAYAIDNDLVMGQPQQGFWSKIAKRGIPEGNPMQWDKQDCFVWPDPARPPWPELVQLAVPEKTYQALYAGMDANGFWPVWIDAFTVSGLAFQPSRTYFDVIFRPRLGATYAARHGLDGAEYQAAFDTWVKDKKYRLVHVESYWSYTLGKVCYAPIFVKAAGPAFAAYHGKSKQEHQALFDDLTDNKGFVPVNISVVSSGGQRVYTALYEQRDAGAVDARSTLTVAEYQQRFTDNAKKGLNLAYVNAYLHQGDLNIVAIWHQKAPAPSVHHHLDQTEYDTLQKQERAANRYTRAVAGYQRGAEPNYVGIWSGAIP